MLSLYVGAEGAAALDIEASPHVQIWYTNSHSHAHPSTYTQAVWTASSPFIHPITKSNFLFGVEHLKDYIDTDQIPQFVEGGKCQCEGGKCLQVPMQPDRSVVAVKEKEKERKEEKKAMNDSNSNTSDAAAEELAAGMSAVNINANSNDATATVNADIDASIATDAGANAGTDTGASASTGAGTDADALSTADNA